MDKAQDKIWFHKSTTIDCKIENINNSLDNLGEHYKKLMSVYPGMTTVELIEQGKDYVIIKTNEGLMKRTNISVLLSEDKTIVDFDEEYITSKLTTNSHFVERFDPKNDKTEANIKISNLVAPGFLGFLLRNFGGKSIGQSFLNSYKKVFEE